MNHTYSIIYNAALGQYQVASEKTKTRRSKVRKLLPIVLASLLAPALAVNIDGGSAVNVSDHPTLQWDDYTFITKNNSDQFGFSDWKQALEDSLAAPNDPAKQVAWKNAQADLKTTISNYVGSSNGYLNIDTDKQFDIQQLTTMYYGYFVVINVESGKNLSYQGKGGKNLNDQGIEQDGLFKITGQDSSLIITTNTGASIAFKDFFIPIYNSGNVYIGDHATFTRNSTFSSPTTPSFANIGGAIYNSRIFILGDYATFTGNSASYDTSSGGAIYNNIQGVSTIGAGARFIQNEVKATSVFDSGGAIYNFGILNLNTGIQHKDTTLFSGNLLTTLNLQGNETDSKANSIYLNDSKGQGILNITGDGILDMRDPISGNGTVNQNGNTTWKLGGDNTMANLHMNKGTLYLYGQDEVDNANRVDATAKVNQGNLTISDDFVLGQGAVLHVGGQGHTINANRISLSDATFRFNLHNAVASGGAILTLISDDGYGSTGTSKIDIHTLAQEGKYTLIDNLLYEPALDQRLYIRGEPIAGTLLNNVYQLSYNSRTAELKVLNTPDNQVVTWTGATSNRWNMTDKNWDGRDEHQYLLGDRVIFGNAGNQDIAINAGGVVVSDMVVSKGSYKFSGGGIETTSNVNGSVITTSQQRLVINDDAIVDFTGITGMNSFAGGVAIYDGALSISTLSQLGTSFSKMSFGRGAILNFTDSIIVDGQSADQRISVETGANSLTLNVANDKTLVFKNYQFDSNESTGGIIFNDGFLTLNGHLVFTGNSASYSSDASGGVIYNIGTFRLDDKATFTANNVSSTASGGVIYNNADFILGSNATFTANNISSTASGGVILNNGGVILNTGGQNDITLFQGNLVNNQARSIYQSSDWAEFHITGNGTLDMRDPFGGKGTFKQIDNGVWKLGGDNTTTNLDIQQGTLYLYADGEVSNPNANNANARVSAGKVQADNIVLGSVDYGVINSATLIANGGNRLSGTNLTLHAGSTFGFKVNGAAAVMQWNFPTITHVGDGRYTFDVSAITTGSGRYHLLTSTKDHGFVEDKLTLDYKGILQVSGRLKETIGLVVDTKNVYVDYSEITRNAIATWANHASSGTWNTSSNDWDLNVEGTKLATDTFMDKDQVIFGANTQQQTINIPDQVVVGNMSVTGGNYKFTGNGIMTDKTGLELLAASTEKLTITGNAAVDFTGITGTNSFGNGIHLDESTLTVSQLSQLGTNFLSVTFGTDATLNFTDSIIVDGKGGYLQRISVSTGSKLTLNGRLTFTGHSSFFGGAIYNIGTFTLGNASRFEGNVASYYYSSYGGAIFNGSGTFTLGNDSIFKGNQVSSSNSSSNSSYGGAIFNGSGTFTLGNDSIFKGNQASSNFSYGGAIYNDGSFTIGQGAQFIENEAISKTKVVYGGAIYNAGTLDLSIGKDQDTLFKGNLADGRANAIHMGITSDPSAVGGTLNIKGNGTLDMRDPITGRGTVNQKDNVLWKLSGDNNMHALNIESGTLYLYADNEVDNANRLDATAKVSRGNVHATNMALGFDNNRVINGATLIANGGNRLSGTNLRLHSGSTFGFKVNNSAAVMQWNFPTITHVGDGRYTFDVSAITTGSGRYHLLSSTSDHGFDKNKLTLNYHGTATGRVKETIALDVSDLTNVYVDYLNITRNAIATWVNTSSSGTWNTSSNDWNLNVAGTKLVADTFMDNDQVIFEANTQQQVINIANQVVVGDMTVNAGDYKFTGNGIMTDKTGLELLAASTEKLIITGNAAVDFTGITGSNHFANGINLKGGNLTVNDAKQLGTTLSNIEFGTQGVLNLSIAKSDTFNAVGALSSQLGTVNQTGAGTWLVQGDNAIGAFNLKSGNLVLDDLATLTATTMTLGSHDQHSQVVMQSGNELSGDTLQLNSGGAQGSTTFGVNLTADNYVTSQATNVAAMQWNFATIRNDGGQYTFDVSAVSSGLGKYHVLNSMSQHGLNVGQLTLKYAGYDPNTVGRLRDVFNWVVDQNNIYLDYSKLISNGVATWANSASKAMWNVADQNWSVAITNHPKLEHTFLNYDHVIFGQNAIPQVIEIPMSVKVAGMEVVGGDYTFTGEGITSSSNGIDLPNNPTEQLTISGNATVDFTGITDSNHFANGINLKDGDLTVSDAKQLGTTLSNIEFGTQGVLNLAIAKSDTFNATGTLSSQLGTVNQSGAGTWLVQGDNSIGAFNLKSGNLVLDDHATLTATMMTLGSHNQHSQVVMQSGNVLSGDTLQLHSGGAQGSTTFGVNLTVDNYVTPQTASTAAMQWNFAIIRNDGGNYIFDVSAVTSGLGKYHVLNSMSQHGLNINQLTLKYAGYDPNSVGRLRDIFNWAVDQNNIYLDYNKLISNGVATWANNASTATWNVADQNWSVAITNHPQLEKTFLNNDHVIFGQNAIPQVIEIPTSVKVAGMEVVGGDYAFRGEGIATASNGIDLLNNPTEQLTISGNARVDFTGITGSNHFANGINLKDGDLTVSDAKQLGTALSGIEFGTQGVLNLSIAKSDTFNAVGALSSQLGTVNQTGAGTWLVQGDNAIGAFNLKSGNLVLDDHATLTATTMTVGSQNQHSQVAMKLGNELSGDTLQLNSGGAQGSTTFGVNLTADNYVTSQATNVAAMQWNFTTIRNDGGQYTFDVSAVSSGLGKYHVLNSTSQHGLNTNQLTLKYAGYDPNSVGRLRDIFNWVVDQNNIYLDYNKLISNGVATWANNASTATWNVADQNWSVALQGQAKPETTFLNQDAVVFGHQSIADQTINIDAGFRMFDVNGMLVDGITNYTFTGDGLRVMAGKTIVKQNTGRLAFNNHVIGDVDLRGGSLIIGTSSQHNQAKLTGNVVAHSGTLLGGHGTIEGIATLQNGATLSPGNSIGTLAVGELNLTNGSNVVLDAAPNGQSDKIIAKKFSTSTGTTSGNINIGQNVGLNIVASAGQWSDATRYQFMTAEGVITGTFAKVTSNIAFLTPTLVTSDKGAPELVMTRNGIAMSDLAQTYNQRATAGAINALTKGHAVYDAVISMSDSQARWAYDNLSGELYASTDNALFQNVNRLHDGMLSRIHEQTTGIWLDGWGYTGSIKGDGNAVKLDNKGSGLLLGYDWAMKENVLIGAALGYEESKIKIKEHTRKGENTVKSTHFMVYGTVDLEVIELKAGVNYSGLRYKAKRDITVPTLTGTAHAKYRGHQVHAFVGASKTFSITERYDLAPYVNVAYTEISAKDFTETGSAAALHAKGQSHHRTSVTLGIKNDWFLDTDRNLGITADVGWKHTFGDQTLDKRFNFVGSDADFTIRSASINRNSAVLGLGIKGQYKDVTIDVGYQGEFNGRVKDHALGAQLKWNF